MHQQDDVFELLRHHLSSAPGVDLAVVYGSYGTARAHERSDVDVFFVPAAGASPSGMQVIIDDVGYDIWPVPWERLDRIAALADGLTALLMDGRVIAGTPAARERFEALRARCRSVLDDVELRSAAARSLRDRAAVRVSDAIASVDAHPAYADAVGDLLTAEAFHRGEYIAHGIGPVLDFGAPWLSGDLWRAARHAILADRQTQARAIGFMLAAVLYDEPSSPVPETDRPAMLSGFYEELHSTLTKISAAASRGESYSAAVAAIAATREIGTHLRLLRTGRWAATDAECLATYRAEGLPDLLGTLDEICYDDEDEPYDLSEAAAELTRRLPALLRAAGVSICQYEDASALVEVLGMDADSR